SGRLLAIRQVLSKIRHQQYPHWCLTFRFTRDGRYSVRVLVLTQVLAYPPDAGPKIKTLQVLQHLAAQHDVVYRTFVRSEKEVQDAEKLGEMCRRVITVPLNRSRVGDVRFLIESLLMGDSFVLRRDYRASMRETARRLL